MKSLWPRAPEGIPARERPSLAAMGTAVWGEFDAFHPRLYLVSLLLAPLPVYVGARLRAALMRRAGFRIGHGTLISDLPLIAGVGDVARRLTIGANCYLNLGCVFELAAEIQIEDQVAIGPQVMVLTTTHELGPWERRAGATYARPVRVERGVWLGARCTILPGVSIGAGAVVAAGAVVTKDVAAKTLVAGVPARSIKELS
jgi:maltose O-acetyltransferase